MRCTSQSHHHLISPSKKLNKQRFPEIPVVDSTQAQHPLASTPSQSLLVTGPAGAHVFGTSGGEPATLKNEDARQILSCHTSTKELLPTLA